MNNNQKNTQHNAFYYQKYITLLGLFLFALGCLFTWNAYKALLGFVSVGVEDSLPIIAMFTSYALPVVCFILFFFNSFIKENKKITKWIAAISVLVVAAFNLIVVGINFKSLYENSQAGHFINFTTIGLTYPVDVLVVNSLLVALQAFNIFILVKPESRYANVKKAFCAYEFFKFNLVEKIFVTILAVITMGFIGDFFNCFSAIENVKYDGKYIFLMLMIFVVPLMNLIYFICKPSIRSISLKTNKILHGICIGINLVFVILLIVFAFTYPDFIAIIGKPFFPLAFLISIPTGPYVLILIALISTVFQSINLIKKLLKNKEVE